MAGAPQAIDWPSPSDALSEADAAKILYQAQITAAADEAKARLQADLDRRNASLAADDALNLAVHNAYLDTWKAALERARTVAQFVQVVAAAVGTLYSAILALTFGAAKDSRPLPVYGIYPALFLGGAMALSAAYLAYIRSRQDIPGPTPSSLPVVYQYNRIAAFGRVVQAMVVDRVYFLHAAIFSLAFGVALLPAPYFPDQQANLLGLVAAVAGAMVFLLPLVFRAQSRG